VLTFDSGLRRTLSRASRKCPTKRHDYAPYLHRARITSLSSMSKEQRSFVEVRPTIGGVSKGRKAAHAAVRSQGILARLSRRANEISGLADRLWHNVFPSLSWTAGIGE
jgi:hypothetical protein